MGRTFGLLIVSIGLWLVVSLPTREPMPERNGASAVTNATAVPATASAVAGSTAPAPSSSETRKDTAVRPGFATPASQPTAVVADNQRTDSLAIQPPSTGRPRRVADERALAARGREIESEPEAALPRPPEPVQIGSSGTRGT